jgi:hypothetical protein
LSFFCPEILRYEGHPVRHTVLTRSLKKRSHGQCRAGQIEKGEHSEIPGPHAGAIGAVARGRVRGGDAQHLQIPYGRGVG